VDGFLQLDAARQQLQVMPEECLVCLETAHNLLIDFLWSRGYVRSLPSNRRLPGTGF